MSYSYQFKFYQTDRTLARASVVQALAALADRGARVLDYQGVDGRVRVRSGSRWIADDAVAQDNECLVRLLYPGPVEVIFQAYAPETLGAQITIAIDEVSFELTPGLCSDLLIDLAKVVNLHVSPTYAWGDHELILERLESSLRFDRISALAWANIFSRPLADRVFVASLKQAPAYQVWDSRQAVVFLLSATPVEPPRPETVQYLKLALPGVTLNEW